MTVDIAGLDQLTEVGRGGFAVVYRAEQPAFRRIVAVKVLNAASLDEAGRDRFARECQASVVIRGLRAVSDFEYEFQLASMNRRLDRNIETVFLTPAENHTFVSASLVKEIARYGGDVSQFVHPEVYQALRRKFP